MQRPTGVDHAEAPRLGRGTGAVGGAHALEEFRTFHFDAIRRAAAAGARQALLHRQVEQQGEVRNEAIGGPALQFGDALERLAAATALVGVAGVGEAVGQDPASRRQRGTDGTAHQLGARGEHEQQLGLGGEPLELGIEQHRADGLAGGRAAGFARDQHIVPLRRQLFAHGAEHGALARTFTAFQGDETSALAHRCNW